MLICAWCGREHEPGCRDNRDRPVCPRCFGGLWACCPSPLFTTRAAELAACWPARVLNPLPEPSPADDPPPDWEVHIGWEARR